MTTSQSFRRRRTDMSKMAVGLFVLLSILPSENFAAGYLQSHQYRMPRLHTVAPQRLHYRMSTHGTREDTDMPSSTWSRNGLGKSSRFGVRRRVRDVLEKARKRTGVQNDSSEQSQGSLISEAASLGAFIDETNFVLSPASNGAVFPKNDTHPTLALESSYQHIAVSEEKTKERNGETIEVDSVLTTSVENVDPLPFSLPQLTDEQQAQLDRGERVQHQSKMGREGTGFVVMDIPAPAYAIWECLLDFENYPEYIGTVRSMRMFTNTHLKQSYFSEKPVPSGTGMETRHYGMKSISRAAFVLSKFRLTIAAIHQYFPHPDGHYMVFTLDKACRNVVLQDAKGIWYTQDDPDGKEGTTRVWLLCELQVSPMLPSMIVDYAANRAMPRATTWLEPTVKTFCDRWFGRERPNGGA